MSAQLSFIDKRQRLRQEALSIWKAGVNAADATAAVLRAVTREGDTLIAGSKRYHLPDFRNVCVIGAGKASRPMAAAIEQLIGDQISREQSLINVKYGDGAQLKHIRVNECGHPIPDRAGFDGASKIAKIAESAGVGALTICVISGGASALLPLPAEPVTLEDKKKVTALLLECGATIHEINTLRKHISQLKGGQLAMLCRGEILTLILSDVIGNDLDVIGSGPTVPDRSSFADAKMVLDTYRITDRVPETVRQRIEKGMCGEIDETPKEALSNTHEVLVGSNLLAMDGAAKRARELGFQTMLLSSCIKGETREVALVHAAIAKEIVHNNQPLRRPACVISGGETTVTVTGNGKGGRNQEFALAGGMDIDGLEGVAMLSAGTDGTDGPTDAAGAVADWETLERAKRAGMIPKQFLANNDSYRFFDKLGDLVHTGRTNTNVMDLRLTLIR